MKWIIEGAEKVSKTDHKVEDPKCVKDAVAAYREDNDWLGHFIADCCEVDDSFEEKSGELYQQYRAYCIQNGEYTRSTTDWKWRREWMHLWKIICIRAWHRKRKQSYKRK